MDPAEGLYRTEERVTIAEAPNLRVRRLRLAPGQCVPWHYHSHVTDTFFCMEGPMRVRARDPDEEHLLQPGESCSVAPLRPHQVEGLDGGGCRFLIVQGVGVYDYIAVDDG